MKKTDILRIILGAAAVVDPRIGLAEKGVEALIHRDKDPSNDIEETADALTDIAINGILAAEDVSGKDFVADEVLTILGQDIKTDIRRYVARVKALKPSHA